MKRHWRGGRAASETALRVMRLPRKLVPSRRGFPAPEGAVRSFRDKLAERVRVGQKTNLPHQEACSSSLCDPVR